MLIKVCFYFKCQLKIPTRNTRDIFLSFKYDLIKKHQANTILIDKQSAEGYRMSNARYDYLRSKNIPKKAVIRKEQAIAFLSDIPAATSKAR